MFVWHTVDRTLRILSNGLDGSALRHKVLANNIANIDTPNFKRQDVNFINHLKAEIENSSENLELKRTNEKHLSSGTSNNQPRIIQTGGSVREDGNNVNIDVEMARLAENGVYYNTIASVVAKKYAMIDRAIRGGER